MCSFKSGVSGAPRTVSVSLLEIPVDADICLGGNRDDLYFVVQSFFFF